MDIDIDSLEIATKKILNHLRECGIEIVNVDKDFYWNISEEYIYDIHNIPRVSEVGQLTDDWNEIKDISEGKQEIIAFSLVRLAAIFRFLGEKIVA